MSVNCGGHFASSCAGCKSSNDQSQCLGDCEWHAKSEVCQLKASLIVRLASSESTVKDSCSFFYVRVPKTGSTSIHNTLVQDESARRRVCTQKKHVTIPVLDGKYQVDKFLASVRDPYERFASQYRYMFGNTAFASE